MKTPQCLCAVLLGLLSTAAFLSSTGAASEDAIAAAIRQGDAFDQQLKTKEALAAYLEAEKLGGSDADLFRKISREYALAMTDTNSKDEKLALGAKAVSAAQRAVATDPKNATAHLALAICYGRVAPLLGNKTKIAYSKLVKEHAEKSIALEGSDDYAYHVLGAWHYEMAGLNPVLRTVAKLIYGAFPPASYDDAVKNLKKAVALAPQRVAHRVELGRSYAAMGQTEVARAELNKGLALPSREKDDAESKQRAKQALTSL